MIDKYGRVLTEQILEDGSVRYSTGGISIVVPQDLDPVEAFNAMLPDVNEYVMPAWFSGKRFADYPAFKPDFGASQIGGELQINFDLVEAREMFRSLIFRNYETRMEEVFELYPHYEPEGWSLKRFQAQGWLALSAEDKLAAMATYATLNCQYRILFAETSPTNPEALSTSGIDDLAMRIFTNGQLFEQYYGEVTGYKTNLIREMLEAQTGADFMALDVTFTAIRSLRDRV